MFFGQHLLQWNESRKTRSSNKRVKVEPKDDVENSANPERPMAHLTEKELDLLMEVNDADAVHEYALRLEEPSESIDKPSVSSVPYSLFNDVGFLKLRKNQSPLLP